MARNSRDAFDPADRELCPDGACIGLIGPDGRCKVCGHISPSAVQDPRNRGLRPSGATDDDAELQIEAKLIPASADGGGGGHGGDDGGGGHGGDDGGGDDGGGDDGGDDGGGDDGSGGDGGGDDALIPATVVSTEPDSDDDTGARVGEDDFEVRRLCPDGACIGLIGTDGRCKVCGTAAAD